MPMFDLHNVSKNIYLKVFCLIESSSVRNHMASDLHDVLYEMTAFKTGKQTIAKTNYYDFIINRSDELLL